MQQYKGYTYTPVPKTAWDNLSLAAKAEMMKIAVRHGITTLQDIKDKYNEFAEGGNTDDDLVDWIIREEGFIGSPQDIGDGKMTIGSGLTAQKWHDQYKRNGNRWTIDDNRRAVKEEVANRRKWAERNIPNWDSLPSSSQKALLSYKYNYDFNRANSPKLFKALADSNLQEAARQMDATSSNAMFRKGLQSRRQREQEWFLRDAASPQMPNTFYQPAVSTQVYNPYVQEVESTRMLPVREPDPNSYIRTREVSPQEQRRRRFQENLEAYQRFNALMDMIDIKKNPTPSYVPNHPLFELVNGFADGGDTNPGMTGMMKSKLATAAHFGNPTARRMTNYDTRSYTWPGEYEYDNGIGEPKRGNVFVGSYGNLVTPQIQDTGKGLTFIEDVWSPENDRRSFMQSLKFNNEEDAKYFGEHYKEVAPMMNLYRDGGHKIHIKPENRGKFTALKERTGHSATWFKEHGTPAQKKMATFALNSKHWNKNALGGYLKGEIYDLPEEEIMKLINAGYEIEYL